MSFHVPSISVGRLSSETPLIQGTLHTPSLHFRDQVILQERSSQLQYQLPSSTSYTLYDPTLQKQAEIHSDHISLYADSRMSTPIRLGDSELSVEQSDDTLHVSHYGQTAMTISSDRVHIGNKIPTLITEEIASSTLQTWHAVNIDNYHWQRICWSSELGLFCAVSVDGFVAISSNGTNWTRPSMFGKLNEWSDICWSPQLGLFCAVGADVTFTEAIVVSPDGINWTLVNQSATNNQSILAISWSSELALFCAVGSGPNAYAFTSSDGYTWTAQSTLDAGGWTGICWSPQLGRFCAITNDFSNNRFAISHNGALWVSPQVPQIDMLPHSSICWSAELGLFCASVYPPHTSYVTKNNQIITSQDGVNWTFQSTPQVVNLSHMTWSPELGCFCGVCVDTLNNRIVVSRNGVDWELYSTGISSEHHGICWSPDLRIFCAVSANNTPFMISDASSMFTSHLRDITIAVSDRQDFRISAQGIQLSAFSSVYSELYHGQSVKFTIPANVTIIIGVPFNRVISSPNKILHVELLNAEDAETTPKTLIGRILDTTESNFFLRIYNNRALPVAFFVQWMVLVPNQ